jgi:hypothetical protein
LEKIAQYEPSYHVLFPKYNYNDQVYVDENGRACSTNRETRNAYRILLGKIPPGKSRSMWVDNIKMDLKRDGVG